MHNNEIQQIKKFIKVNNLHNIIKIDEIEGDFDFFTVERLWDKVRTDYFKVISEKVDTMYRSPVYGNALTLKNGEKITYSYERNIDCSIVEKKCNNLRESNIDWERENIIYSSGMSCILSAIQNYMYMNRKMDRKIRMAVYGAYYESRMIFSYMESRNMTLRYCNNERELNDSIIRSDIIFIEPVRYDWDMDVLNIPLFLNELREALKYESKPKMLIFDSTLIAEELPIRNILDCLTMIPNLIVCNVNSLLKLHQEGLEFTNAGVLSVYVSKLNGCTINIVELKELFKKIRTICNQGLSSREIMLLDNGFTFCREMVKCYSNKVFLNNALLACALNVDGIFLKISHPILHNKKNYSWGKAPFVIMVLKDDSLDNYGKLLGIIQHEASKRNLPLYYGSSFGFRHCRYEIIIPDLKKKRAIFKVAMGCLEGECRNSIISLIVEIASYETFNELSQMYIDIQPIKLDDLE